MKIRILLATATAASVLMSAALANDTNTLYLEQIGDDNVASVHQSSGGGNNDIGTLSDPLTQEGDENEFQFSNSQSGSGSNNDIVKAEQIGDGNFFRNRVWNQGHNNLIQLFEQVGDSNQTRIDMNGSDNGLIGSVLQQGNSNHLVIDQTGSNSNGNQILAVSMIGDNNGLAPDANGAPQRAGTYLRQSGNGNVIEQVYLEGSNNLGPYSGSGGHRNVQQIRQSGVDNGKTLSVAKTLGSQSGALYNRLWVFQTGNENNFSIEQGVNSASFGNHAVLTQTGNNNLGTAVQFGDENNFAVTQEGDSNVVRSTQTGDRNSVVASIDGDFNGGGALGGGAGTLASNNSLTSGDIVQSGDDNSVLLTITSSLNQFAFKQVGDLNDVIATVSGSGGNSAAVVQVGNSNVSHFSQDGGGNIVTVSQ